MNRREFTLPIAAVILTIVGFLCVDFFASAQPAPDRRVSAQERSSVISSGIQNSTERISLESVKELTVSETVGQNRHSFSAHFTKCVDGVSTGIPLEGVKLQLSRLDSDLSRSAVSGPNGTVLVEGLSAGSYRITAVHDYYVPVESNYLPQRIISVPGVVATCSFAEAWGFAVRVSGESELAGVRLVVGDEFLDYKTLSGPESAHVLREFRRRLGSEHDYAFVKHPANYNSRSIDIWDRDRGPCRFSIPVVPIRSLDTATVCDVSGVPESEPMARLSVLVEDATGKSVELGAFEARVVRNDIHRFRRARITSNGKALVPQGTYRISTLDSLMPWHLPARSVSITPGQTAEVRFQVPVELYQVRLEIVVAGARPQSKILAKRRHPDTPRFSPLKELSHGQLVWLPCGVSTFRVLQSDAISRSLHEIDIEISVTKSNNVQECTLAVF